MKRAIITGITGQDGAYLAQLLLEKGYQVYGTYRRLSSQNFWRIKDLGVDKHPNLKLVEYDLTDLGATIRLLDECEPDEIYNLAAQSFVGVSFKQPNTTAQITGLGALNILEAIRIVNRNIKYYQRQRCLEKYKLYLKQRILHSIRVVRMVLQNYMLIGLQLITAKVTIFSVVAESYSIMNLLCGGLNL